MRIGIDMRMAGTGEGIGRYVEELAKHLAKIDFENEYFLLVQKDLNLEIQNPKFQTVRVRSRYYSWAEQTSFIKELKDLHLDLVHFANFNAPILYRGKFVTTVHDIIHHVFPGKKKSRLFHRLAYRVAIRSAVRHAARIITVSQGTKADIMKTFGINGNKVDVIYEGVGDIFFQALYPGVISEVRNKYRITKPYLLFVGVWRQYKNLPRLAQSFDILKERHKKDIELVLAGKIDPFYPEIKKAVFAIRNASDIRALDYVPEPDLFALYQGAGAVVLPSLIEGFGLIGVEGQASGVPVAASDIAVLREILGAGAVFFDPTRAEDMARQIDSVLTDKGFRGRLVASGKANAVQYRWEAAARKTLEVYKAVIE